MYKTVVKSVSQILTVIEVVLILYTFIIHFCYY